MTALWLMLAWGSATEVPSFEAARAEFESALLLQNDAAKARPAFAACAESFTKLPASPTIFRYESAAADLAGDRPRAVRAIRDAIRLSPAEPELHAALARLRAAIVLPAGAPPPMPLTDLCHRVSAVELFGVAVLGGLLFLVGCLVRTRSLQVVLIVLGLVVWFGATGLAIVVEQQISHAPAIGVVREPSPLLRGNGTHYPAVVPYSLPAGYEVEPLLERGGWWHVALGDGTRGWLPAGQLIVSRSPHSAR